LLFMGNEFGATSEWNYKSELQWDLLQFDAHRLLKDCVRDLCLLLRNEPALYERQFEPTGFEWTNLEHRSESVIVFKRKGKNPEDDVLVVLNMTPVVRRDWKIRVHGKSKWVEIFNSDDKKYWGTGDVFNPDPGTELVNKKEKLFEINLHLPALGALVLK